MAAQTQTIAQAAAALRRGKPAIFPTDTVYGLGVAVEYAPSPQVLYDLKQREQAKPIAWLVASHDDLDRYGKLVPSFAHALARTFWPGALTLIVKASSLVPEQFCSADGTIGLRMPANDTALELIAAAGCPLATTSANLAGQRPPRTFEDVDSGLAAQVGAVVRDAEQKSGVASTILDCTQDHPVMMREGAITVADIQALA